MRLNAAVCLLSISALLAVGCAGTRPIHYYTIELPDGKTVASKADGRTLVVGNIVTPEFLQDGRIRYRTGANEVGAYQYQRWTERPGTLVRDLLVRALRGSGKYRRVLEASSATTGDYLLRGKLHEFGEVDHTEIGTRISLHVELIEMKTNRIVWDRLVERAEAANGKSIQDVVQSMDRNVKQVIMEITTGIEQFLAAP